MGKKRNGEKMKQKMAGMRESKRVAGGTCDSSQDSHLNALRAASPQGSLQTQTVLPPCISTPPSVPSPHGDAVQTNLADLPPCICTSPNVLSPFGVTASKINETDANALRMTKYPGRSLSTTVLPPCKSTQSLVPSPANAGVAVQAIITGLKAVHNGKNETNAQRSLSSTVLAPSKSTQLTVPSPTNLGDAVQAVVTDLNAVHKRKVQKSVHKGKTKTIALINQNYTDLAQSKSTLPARPNVGDTLHRGEGKQNKSDDYGRYIQGRFHQANQKFGVNAGKQCTVMSFMAFTYCQTKPLTEWNSDDMDKVLIEGDNLYTVLQQSTTINHDFIDVQELPKFLDAFGLKFSYLYSDSISVALTENNDDLIAFNSFTLKEAFQILFNEYTACFMTFNAYTSIVLKAGDFFYAFDSHARDKNGRQFDCGKSVLVQLFTIDNAVSYCYSLLHSMGRNHNTYCEVTGVNVTHNGVDLLNNTIIKNASNVTTDSEPHNALSQPGIDTIEISETDKEPKLEHSDIIIISEIENEQAEDIVVISASERNTIDFIPLDANIQQNLCQLLGVPVVDTIDFRQVKNIYADILTKSIAEDGNCFFRAISYAISGSEIFYGRIRNAVVENMKIEENLFKSFLRPQYKCMSEYLQSSQMAKNGTWATEVEILATAFLLNTNIYTFNGNSWLKTSPKLINKSINPNTCGIYLKHCNNNHYEVVVKARSTCAVQCDNGKPNEAKKTASEIHFIHYKDEKTGNNKLTKTEFERKSLPETRDKCNIRNNLLKKRKKSYSKRIEGNRVNKRIKRAFSKNMIKELPEAAQDVQNGKVNEILDEDKLNLLPNASTNVVDVTNAHQNKINKDSNENKNINMSRYQLYYMNNEKYRQRKIESAKQKYKQNERYRNKLIEIEKKKYKNNTYYRKTLIETVKHKYNNNQAYRKKLIEALKQKSRNSQMYRNRKYEIMKQIYKKNEAYRIKVIETAKQKYKYNQSYKDKLIETGKQKYKCNQSYKDKLIETGKQKYKCNQSYKNKLIETGKQKYKYNQSYKDKLIETVKQKYKYNQSYKDKLIETVKQKYKYNQSYKDKLIETVKQKYKWNQSYKNKSIETGKQKYKCNQSYKNKLIETGKQKYKCNQSYKDKLIEAGKQKYKCNQSYKNKLIETGKQKYKCDQSYKNKLIETGKQKYKYNQSYTNKLIETGKQKYKNDQMYREQLKKQSVSKYLLNFEHREKIKKASVEKYKTDEVHKKSIKEANAKRKVVFRNQDLHKSFQEKIRRGPEYICCSCHRLLFVHQVSQCVEKNYESKGTSVLEVAEKCITKKYLHVCTKNCDTDCILMSSPRSKLWICFTCHRKILNGVIPAESEQNNLMLEPIPQCLACLNSLEQHLIALHIPFIKVLALPKGGQYGVHGPVVCVPSDIERTTKEMPRSDGNNKLIQVKLKRKLSYKGYYRHDYVDQKQVEDALAYLKENNRWYLNVSLNENWLNPIHELESCPENDHKLNTDNVSHDTEVNSNCAIVKDETEDEFEERTNGIQLDSCLQPVDIGQHVLDEYLDEILNLAPAEGNNPVKILNNECNEAKTFPVQFPNGSNTYNDNREEKITLTRYFNTRLMNADNRFAKDTNYIFYSQYMSELDHVISSVSVACRKGKKTNSQGEEITAGMLKDKRNLQELFKSDQIYKFLNPVRGTPPYWQTAQKDLFAMLRQLGIPTWFCSFSSADMRWEEIIGSILIQQDDKRNVKDLDWNEKCNILKSNPVTAARMFDHRFHIFLRSVILSDAAPIGKVKDYREEFQKRGSPHTHCVFWVDDAPKFNEDDDEIVASFIDRYISCGMPDKNENPELYEIVTNVQQHSKKHSKSCQKKGTKCRFNFPRPPSERTFISRTKDTEMQDTENMTLDEAKNRIQSIWQVILGNESENLTCHELFEKAGQSQSMFEEAFKAVSQRNEVILKREPNDIWTNQYNAQLLKCWNANMDIQFILDAYACIVYVISYISKAEREMGLLLRQTKIEAEEANLDAQQTMKKLGTTYLNSREVSAQESVYRVCSLRLKEGSRKVQFVPVGENPVRMRIPLKYLSEESDNIWMSSINDKYLSRPATIVFEKMTLAEFCSQFRILAKSQIPKYMRNDNTEPKSEIEENCNIYKLQKDMGYVQKRSRTDPAVIRYPRFSVTKSPELYYQSILELFLPHRFKEQLKPPPFETYENFYEAGSVQLTPHSKIQLVKDIVDANQHIYDIHGKEIDEAEQILQDCEPQNAWAHLCPETELERDECKDKAITTVEEEEQTNDINLHTNSSNYLETIRREATNNLFTKAEMQPYLCSMNRKQTEVFYKVRQWCLDVKQDKKPKPFHLFITGGAGVGKSHLIKCIYYEAARLLSQVASNPDDKTVLIMAPTGTAAYNIKGQTIHSALSIPIYLTETYVPLPEEKLNTLRSKLANLQMVIIDEISMVNKRLFYYISERLRQIKKTRQGTPFGNISVLVVGDFYQIPPVLKFKKKDKQKMLLYSRNASDPVDLWNDHFSIVELDQIMRQLDDLDFASMLNRCRVKPRSEQLNDDDLNMLRKCCNSDLETALHIFPRNEDVDKHNIAMFNKLDTHLQSVEAEDYVKDKRSGSLVQKKSSGKNLKTNLENVLHIAERARVMLIRNIDVSDGLVNGVIGTVVRVMPKQIFVVFDNVNVGKIACKRNHQLENLPDRAVCIEKIEEHVENRSGIVRKQFPLKLAWACTVHKVQGLTLDNVVVSLDKSFTAGMAYVALSRVTSLAGLHIKENDDKTLHDNIYCAEGITDALNDLPNFIQNSGPAVQNTLTINLHNIQGLNPNFANIQRDCRLQNADYICLTETWLTENQSEVDGLKLDQFVFHSSPRSSSYDHSNSTFELLKNQMFGGVGVYAKEDYEFQLTNLSIPNLEYICFSVPSTNLTVVTIYRPNSYTISLFHETMLMLINRLEACKNCLVMGDFNQDIFVSSSIKQLLESHGYKQLIEESTTEGGTLIDHVYKKGLPTVDIQILPTYYSYHEAISIHLAKCM